MRRRTRVLVPLLVAAATAPFGAGAAQAHNIDEFKVGQVLASVSETASSSANMTYVGNLQHRGVPGTGAAAQSGSDIEFMKVAGREYALAGTLRNGMQINDITDPTAPVKTATYDCPITQGDIQVFQQGQRTLATYTADSAIGAARLMSTCVREANALGFDISGTELGTFIVDLSNPAKPRTLSFLEIPTGSHNQTISPDGRWLYNSNSDLLTNTRPAVTIWDVADPSKPRFVQDYVIPFTPTSLGSNSHDIFFAPDGTRAYVAALSQTIILDTTDPAAPKRLPTPAGFVPTPTVPDAGRIVDPTNNVVHQSDIVTLQRADGTDRTLLIVTDERAGAAASGECPGGGLHVYDVTGAREASPVKLGTWFITPSALPYPEAVCTSHMLRVYEEQELLTIAWYSRGVRVLDLSGLADFEPTVPGGAEVAYGSGIGMTELGHFEFPDGDTWSFKTNRIAADSSFYGYGNDLSRGMDVYRFTPAVARPTTPLEPVQTTDVVPDEPAAEIPEIGLTVLLPLVALGVVVVVLRRRRPDELAAL